MKLKPLLLLPMSMALSTAVLAQRERQGATAPAADSKAAQEAEELRALRAAFSEVLDSVNKSWFGEPYQQIRAVDLSGNLAIVFSGAAVEERI